MGQRVEIKLQDHYRELHEENPQLFAGGALNIHAVGIKQLIDKTKSKSLLDYGCGKGAQYTKQKLHEQYFNGIMPHLYDPGVVEFSEYPKATFDGVISTDVLEHIPEDEILGVLNRIFETADKFVYLGICTVPADSFLPDGRNSHVTLHDHEWWVDMVDQCRNPEIYTQVNTYGNGKKDTVFRPHK